MLGIDTGGWINKMKGMIYHFMVEGWNPLDSTSMLPTHQNGQLYVVQCDGQESGSITSGYDS